MYKSKFPENHKVDIQDFKEELVGKSNSMILNAENADFRDNEEAEKEREKEMEKDKAEHKVPGMPHKEGYKRYVPLTEELIDDSKSTVKDSIGGDFTLNDKEKEKLEKEKKAFGMKDEKEKKEESVSRYKSPFMENEESEEDENSAEALVDSWINGNKKHVIEKLKSMRGGHFEDAVHALVAELVRKKDESGIKYIITALSGK